MRLSYIIVTHNRRDALLRTLGILARTTPLPAGQWETWVVDNGSSDGTVAAVREQFSDAHIIERPTNEGVWARSHAFKPARGEYVILLDDDSYPVGDAAKGSMAFMDGHPECAALVGRVVLPDGSFEACAFPTVMLSGAVCLRRSALLEVGGFAREFFRKAGEYDFSFRLWELGFTVERFEDVIYFHDKVVTGRSAPLAHRMDLRNNLILVERYLPRRLRRIYRRDWILRYTAMARHADCASAARLARWEARVWRIREFMRGRRVLGPEAIEIIFQLDDQAARIAEWAGQNRIKRVVIADFSKNIHATFQGCSRAGLVVSAIAESHPAFAGMSYRNVPIVALARAAESRFDGVVISNVNPAQVDAVEARISAICGAPILRLWNGKTLPPMERAA